MEIIEQFGTEKFIHKIIVAGIGPGSPDYVLPAALQAIAGAQALVGSRRALAAFTPPGLASAKTKVIDKDIVGVMAFIREKLVLTDVVVMVSGDPGFHSLLPALKRHFPIDLLKVIPGLSSLQLAFASEAEVWQDAELISMHGREANTEQLRYQTGRKLGLLTDGFNNPSCIAVALLAADWPPKAKVSLCAKLSYPDETICHLTLATAAAGAGEEFTHCVMIVKVDKVDDMDE